MTFSASVYRRHGGRHRLVVVKLTTAPFSQHSPETDVEDLVREAAALAQI